MTPTTFHMRAILREEAAAFVDTSGGLLLLRPPYRLADLKSVTEADLSDAIVRIGYKAEDSSFRTWQEVVAYLRDQHLAWRREKGVTASGTQLAHDAINKMSKSLLLDLLNRVGSQLAGPRSALEIEPLEAGLISLLSLPKVSSDSELVAKVGQLLAECKRKANSAASVIHVPDVGDVAAVANKIQHKVRLQHSIYALA